MRAKVAPLEKNKGSCRSCGVTRCEICKHIVSTETFKSFSTKENIALSQITYTVVPTLFGIFFRTKHVQNNTQVLLKVSDLDLTIISQPTGISLKGIPSNKRHFLRTLRMTNIMV